MRNDAGQLRDNCGARGPARRNVEGNFRANVWVSSNLALGHRPKEYSDAFAQLSFLRLEAGHVIAVRVVDAGYRECPNGAETSGIMVRPLGREVLGVRQPTVARGSRAPANADRIDFVGFLRCPSSRRLRAGAVMLERTQLRLAPWAPAAEPGRCASARASTTSTARDRSASFDPIVVCKVAASFEVFETDDDALVLSLGMPAPGSGRPGMSTIRRRTTSARCCPTRCSIRRGTHLPSERTSRRIIGGCASRRGGSTRRWTGPRTAPSRFASPTNG